MDIKKCSVCKLAKKKSNYQANGRSRDGLNSQCKDCRREYHKSRAVISTMMTEKTCYRCSETKPATEFNRNTQNKTGLTSYCKLCARVSRKAWYDNGGSAKIAEANRDLKQNVLNAYGSHCSCCGESEVSFLALDHVNNDGNLHRRELKGSSRGGSSYAIYRWAKENGYPDSLQLLCHNCNISKHINKGICAHALTMSSVIGVQ